jgi:molybdopterin-binding protein
MPCLALLVNDKGAARHLMTLFASLPEGTQMRLSARNQIKGIVLNVKKGATTAHVRIDIGGGQTMMSSITNEAVDELGIKLHDHVIVVIKASDVMLAVD